MTEKFLGYTLLLLGIIIIIASAVSVFFVFTKQSQPATLFNFPGITMDLSQILAGNLPEQLRDSGMTLPPIKQEIVTSDMVNTPMNLIFHTIMMGFIASAGMKLAQIGTMLVRSIDVHLKESATKNSTEHLSKNI